MNKQIWKFKLDPGTTKIEMPKGAEVLSTQTQDRDICIWALVNPAFDSEIRQFEVYPTGEPIYYGLLDQRSFIGTAQIKWMVFHVFELI
jgi:hypothetical protein